MMATEFPKHMGQSMAYMRSIINASKQFRWPSWVIYDIQYREEMAATNPPTNEDQARSSAASGNQTPQDHLTPTPSEERMDIQLLSDSLEKLDLDGILDETIEGS